MTLNDIIQKLQDIAARGHGDKETVIMGRPNQGDRTFDIEGADIWETGGIYREDIITIIIDRGEETDDPDGPKRNGA